MRWALLLCMALGLGACGDDGSPMMASDAGPDAQISDAATTDAEPDATIPPPCTENCVDTEACDDNTNCVSGLCKSGVCMAATCGNAALDGTETEIDCGGLCGPCDSCAAPPTDTRGSCRCEFAHYSMVFDANLNRAAYAATPNDIWAIGEGGKVLRHNGTSWRGFFAGNLPIRVVHGSGPDDVWFGGTVGSMWHWDGATISAAPEPPATVHGLAVLGPSDAWAVGDAGAVWRWDGAAWNVVESNTTVRLQHVFALNESDVWFVGGQGTVLRWDGSTLSPDTTDLPLTGSIVSVWGSSPSDMWVVGQNTVYHWDGAAWNFILTPSGLNRYVNGVSADEVWLGTPSSALHYQSGEITEYDFDELQSVSTNGFEQPIAAASRSATVMALAHSLRRWNGANWKEASLTVEDLNDIAGSSPTEIYACGNDNLVYWDGVSWSKIPTPGVSNASSIWVFSPSDIWLTHASGIYRFDGSTATLSNAATNAFAMWGAAPDDLWAVGSGGSIRHWNGSSWTDETSPTNASLFEIWGDAADNVWAVGAQGTVVHWDGMSWTLDDTFPTNVTLQAVWTNGPDDVWVGGASRTTLHWDGMTWTFRSLPFVPPFFNESAVSIVGLGADIWATSSGSNVYRWNGTAWDTIADGQLCGLTRPTKLWADGTDLWGIGDKGQIIRHVPPPP